MKKMQVFSRWLVLFVILSFLFASWIVDAYGLARASENLSAYIPISTKEELSNIRDNLSAKYYLVNDIIFDAQDFEPGGLFYNDGAGWTPIGTSANPFTGIFDGNGYTITNLVISCKDATYVGFFGTNNGTIKNLGLNDVTVSVTVTSAKGSAASGGIAGKNQYDGTIMNCYVGGQSTISCFSDYDASAGGIVGSNTGDISDCHFSGTVSASAESDSRSVFVYASGIAAQDYAGVIKDCYNTGSVSAKAFVNNDSYYARCHAGGIAGYSSAEVSIKNSYNTGSVCSEVTAGHNSFANYPNYAGGIVGESEGLIRNCYNTGTVTATLPQISRHDTCAAGIAANNSGTVTECYNIGIIRAYCMYETYVGGIVAYNSGSVSICSNLNELYAITDITDYLFGAIGGVVGGNKGSVSDCYNTGTIHNPMHGNLSVGGVAGANYAVSSIARCYNIAITDESKFSGNAYGTAGIAEINNSGCIIQDCYYLDIVTAGVLSGDADTMGCTLSQMKLASTYEGFDFSSVWVIDPNADYPLPTFKEHPSFPKGTISCSKHIFASASVTKQPTCTASGEERSYCIVCDYCQITVLAAKGHYYDHACDPECNDCGDIRTITHSYDTAWHSDQTSHWHVCTNCQWKADEALHEPGAEATETTAQTCTTCGYIIKAALGHKHSYEQIWTTDEAGHWYACSGCYEKSGYAEHDFENACDADCSICGYSRETMHKYDEKWSSDEAGHWHVCTNCESETDKALHEPGAEATSATAQTCTVCGYVLVPALGGADETTPQGTQPNFASPTDPVNTTDAQRNDFSWWIIFAAAVAVATVVFIVLKRK